MEAYVGFVYGDGFRYRTLAVELASFQEFHQFGNLATDFALS
jgi:hypothetical protein